MNDFAILTLRRVLKDLEERLEEQEASSLQCQKFAHEAEAAAKLTRERIADLKAAVGQ